MRARWRETLACALVAVIGSANPATSQAQPRVDARGDALPPGAVARLGSVRFLHEDSVRSLALSPDGSIVMAGCHSNGVRLWAADSGKELRRIGTTLSPDGSFVDATVAALSPDGRVIAAADTGKLVYVWDAATGRELRRLLVDTRATALAW